MGDTLRRGGCSMATFLAVRKSITSLLSSHCLPLSPAPRGLCTCAGTQGRGRSLRTAGCLTVHHWWCARLAHPAGWFCQSLRGPSGRSSVRGRRNRDTRQGSHTVICQWWSLTVSRRDRGGGTAVSQSVFVCRSFICEWQQVHRSAAVCCRVGGEEVGASMQGDADGAQQRTLHCVQGCVQACRELERCCSEVLLKGASSSLVNPSQLACPGSKKALTPSRSLTLAPFSLLLGTM
jgi:hypothetical protein